MAVKIDRIEPADGSFLEVSDAHIGSKASLFRDDDKLLDEMIGRFKTVDHVILNGDFLDLTYILGHGNRHFDPQPEEIETINNRMGKLIPKLEKILTECPDTQIHYMCGNHDGLPMITNRLAAVAGHFANLHVHEDVLQMGDSAFLHGDLDIPSDYTRGPQARGLFTRERQITGNGPGPQETQMYEAMVKELEARGLDFAREGIFHLFSGHTHFPVEQLPLAGGKVIMHNSGAFTEGRRAYIFRGEVKGGSLGALEYEPMHEANLSYFRQ